MYTYEQSACEHDWMWNGSTFGDCRDAFTGEIVSTNCSHAYVCRKCGATEWRPETVKAAP